MNKELLEILLEMSEKSLCISMPGNMCRDMQCANCILRRVDSERTYPETIKAIVNE